MGKKVIRWDTDGYPTEESLEQLSKVLSDTDHKKAIDAFYAALEENFYPDFCGHAKVEVRGETIDVFEYHTGGWSGNESIIGVLKKSPFFSFLLQRYDSGGHYYFKPPFEIKSSA